MTSKDIAILFALTIVIIVGGYQFYFIPQKHPLRAARYFTYRIEGKIPFKPAWVWVYSGLYYPVIISMILTINSFRQFCYIAINFMMLLMLQMTITFIYPVKAPCHWREQQVGDGYSLAFLRLIHHFDKKPVNCFPSMHVAVAMLTALHLNTNLEYLKSDLVLLVFAFPVLIAISALYTKQHYIIDLPFGALLGVLTYHMGPGL